MSTPYVIHCPGCGEPVTAHAPGCKLSLVTNARTLQTAAPSNGHPKLRWSMFEKYLTATELQGKRARLTIDHIEVETTHPRPGETVQAPVLYFRETKRGLILSQTNRRTLAKAFGDDVEACVGKQIIVEAVAVQVAGRATMPIRITAPAPVKVDKTTGEVTDAGK